jgi:hypothetical protein
MPDCARNDGVALWFRISGCWNVTKLQHGIALRKKHWPGIDAAPVVGQTTANAAVFRII